MADFRLLIFLSGFGNSKFDSFKSNFNSAILKPGKPKCHMSEFVIVRDFKLTFVIFYVMLSSKTFLIFYKISGGSICFSDVRWTWYDIVICLILISYFTLILFALRSTL